MLGRKQPSSIINQSEKLTMRMKSLLTSSLLCCAALTACEPNNENQLGPGSHAATSQLGISSDGATV